MNTNMVGFSWFSKIYVSLCFGQTILASALEGFKGHTLLLCCPPPPPPIPHSCCQFLYETDNIPGLGMFRLLDVYTNRKSSKAQLFHLYVELCRQPDTHTHTHTNPHTQACLPKDIYIYRLVHNQGYLLCFTLGEIFFSKY